MVRTSPNLKINPAIYMKSNTSNHKYLLQEKEEHLAKLSKNQKWTSHQLNFKIGDIVIISEENIDRSKWPIAKIID